MKKLLFAALFLFSLSVIIPSCVKTEFDEPPTTGSSVDIDADLIVTIKSLKDFHVSQQIETIADINNGAFKGKYIKGVVAADDESGNFYKNFILQDATGGIVVRVSRSDSYPFYAQGREIFVKLEGLLMGDYRGVIQLGGFTNNAGELEDIVDIEEFLITGERGQPIEPKVITSVNDLTDDDISTLIKLDGAEFALGDTGRTYADAENLNTENRDLLDCDGNVIVVRTSGFADFAGTEIPGGGGSIMGIYSIFQSGNNVTQQLLLRNGGSDVDLDGPRCDGSPDEPDGLITEFFEDFNSSSDGAVVSLPGWSNLAVQESRQWLVGQFNGASYADVGAFNAGGPVESWLISPAIDLTGSRFLSFTSAYAFYAHQGLELMISTDYEAGDIPANATWENINFAMPDGSQDWNVFIESGDLNIASYGDEGHIAFKYTGDGSTDETTTWIIDDICISAEPCTGSTGCPDNDEDGVCAEDDCDDNDPNFPMTPGTACDDGNADTDNDVILSDGCTCAGQGGAIGEIFEDFNDGNDNDIIALTGWSNVSAQGDRQWQIGQFDGASAAEVTAYNAGGDVESWLITPLLDLNGPRYLSFTSAFAFYAHDGLEVFISTDYDGSSPASATWTNLNPTLATSANEWNEYVPSGNIDISTFGSTGYVAFKYTGSDPGSTTNWLVDDICVSATPCQ